MRDEALQVLFPDYRIQSSRRPLHPTSSRLRLYLSISPPPLILSPPPSTSVSTLRACLPVHEQSTPTVCVLSPPAASRLQPPVHPSPVLPRYPVPPSKSSIATPNVSSAIALFSAPTPAGGSTTSRMPPPSAWLGGSWYQSLPAQYLTATHPHTFTQGNSG